MATSTSNDISSLVHKSSALCKLSIDQLTAGQAAETAPAARIEDVRSDFINLLELIGKECTALSLAFKPPATIKAIEGTLVKLYDLLVKLAFCVGSCPAQGALSKEIRWLGEEAFESVQRLLDGSLEGHEATSASKRKQLRERNLTLTAQVWEVVNRAQTVSTTELQALRKIWQSTLGLLDDCLEEVKEMEQQQDHEVESEGDDSEDEDDFRSSHPLSEQERARVTAAHMLLRLGRLLLNRLINSTAPPNPPSTLSNDSIMTRLASLIGEISESADDFALSLEPPQEDSAEVMKSFEEVCKELGTLFGEAVKGQADEDKWLAMWRLQFERAGDKVRSLVE